MPDIFGREAQHGDVKLLSDIRFICMLIIAF
jgi:hypothetical protein